MVRIYATLDLLRGDTQAYANNEGRVTSLVVPKSGTLNQDYALSLENLQSQLPIAALLTIHPEVQKMLDDKQAHAQKVFMEASAQVLETDVDVQRDLRDMGKYSGYITSGNQLRQGTLRIVSWAQQLRKDDPPELLKPIQCSAKPVPRR